jgi:hypothetical protein
MQPEFWDFPGPNGGPCSGAPVIRQNPPFNVGQRGFPGAVDHLRNHVRQTRPSMAKPHVQSPASDPQFLDPGGFAMGLFPRPFHEGTDASLDKLSFFQSPIP